MSVNPGRFASRKLDRTLSARSLYGAELRYYRERAGLSLVELAAKLHIEMSFLARIEQGERRLPDELTSAVDQLLDTGDFFERNIEAARSAPPPGRLSPLAEWEWLATAIREWDAALVPGLLQTDAYARAVAEAYAPVLADRTVRHRWEARLSRTPVLLDPLGPRYSAVVGETALRRPLGGPAVMAGQLRHLADLVRRQRIALNVLPLTATPHPTATDGALRLMTFAEELPLGHFTAHQTGAPLSEPATTSLMQLTHDLLAGAALPPEASLRLIETTAAAYEREDGRACGRDAEGAQDAEGQREVEPARGR
ncbi:putative DNA-binding protein [Actinacidiphila reveromycinica]|uniref:Putative DNA-binding protein n=1 Tax=Actinacidiphila reveromycinica TaxID=659352 RepID=A0A7U3VNA1_9ACTN|nr:helix-turn-helix transcriptional regulator [Streptomyces sp. SN-593]BBA97453.1 putative DNA-binding protein [Streptomyces sp. SN-593]